MLRALTLALGQLRDPAVLRVLFKSLAITLALFLLLGSGLWWLAEQSLALLGLTEARVAGADGIRGLLALVGVVIAGWLLWRIVALAVLQFFADEVVRAVELRHYPAAAAAARQLSFREELANGLAGALRAIGWNLAALPVALVLAVTGFGAPLVFWLVNAVLLGRELQDMVWLRHRSTPDAPSPLSPGSRLMLGGTAAALLTVPVVNLLAPLLGAAAATHLVHRSQGTHGI
jgi:CysZ protein